MGIFKIFRGKRDRKQSPVLSSDVKEQGSSDGPQNKKVDPIVSIQRNLPPDPPGSFPKVVKTNSFRKVQTIQTIQSSALVSLCDTYSTIKSLGFKMPPSIRLLNVLLSIHVPGGFGR
jgi:hypothetical protein